MLMNGNIEKFFFAPAVMIDENCGPQTKNTFHIITSFSQP